MGGGAGRGDTFVTPWKQPTKGGSNVEDADGHFSLHLAEAKVLADEQDRSSDDTLIVAEK
jgi:hypothetical protein